MKTGSTGPHCASSRFEHLRLPRRVDMAIRERQDIVYRDMFPTSPAPEPAKPPALRRPLPQSIAKVIWPIEVLLFRYSALTFNGHRIHYDRDYVTKVEGYPGLVFHGPMQAAFLVEFAARLHGGAAPKKFSLSRRAALVRRQRVQHQRQRHGHGHGAVDREFGRAADDEGQRYMVRGRVFTQAKAGSLSQRERVGVRGYAPSSGRNPSPGAARRPLPAGEARKAFRA